MHAVPEVERELERRVEDLGYELVDLQWTGRGRRPVLQVRIDNAASTERSAVTVADCAKVSRALEAWLDERASLSDRYVLEVSSPGVERPLTRSRDFERFRGEQVVLKGRKSLIEGSNRVEGELLGLEGGEGETQGVRLRLPNGDEVVVPRSEIRKAHLVFSWK